MAGVRSSADQKAARLAGMRGGDKKRYAWFLLTDEEKRAYAVWHTSPEAGVFNVLVPDALPKNWRLLDQGSGSETAKEDVGLVPINFVAAARERMESGGLDVALAEWRAQKETVKP
jgi:hypothetical protein